MIRIVVENLLLFLTPALIYFAYSYLVRQAQPETGGATAGQTKRGIFEDAPYVWLFFIGAAVVLIALTAFGSNSGGKPGQHYSPPTMKDGHIEPGRIE